MSKSTPAKGKQTVDGAVLFQLFNRIGIINQLASTELERVLPHGLTQAQFTVLNHCVRLGDNKTPAELAAAFQITRGTLTTTLKRMTAKGLVELIPDAEDGRSKRVLLTDKGRAAREDAIAATMPLFDRTDIGLTAKEVETLLPLLEKLSAALDQNRST